MEELVQEIVFEKLISSAKFAEDVEKLIISHKLNYIDAIVQYCTNNNIEIETIASIVKQNPKIKAELQSEYEDLNYLPKRAKLQF
jgi:ribosomal silencing factor RsfS